MLFFLGLPRRIRYLLNHFVWPIYKYTYIEHDYKEIYIIYDHDIEILIESRTKNSHPVKVKYVCKIYDYLFINL